MKSLTMPRLHSDDFGYSRHIDKKILQLIQKGKIHSVSVLATFATEASLSELSQLQRSGNVKVAAHLNLIEGSFLSTGEAFPRLSWFTLRILTKRVKKGALKRELQAQINRLTEAGLRIDALDTHQHTHALSPVAELVQQLANEHGVPIVRSYRDARLLTPIARLKYDFLRLVARASHLIWYGRFELPRSWRHWSDERAYAMMSWEGKGFDVNTVAQKHLSFVIHPFLGYDGNTSYEPSLLASL